MSRARAGVYKFLQIFDSFQIQDVPVPWLHNILRFTSCCFSVYAIRRNYVSIVSVKGAFFYIRVWDSEEFVIVK
jgi:hypothetical protein